VKDLDSAITGRHFLRRQAVDPTSKSIIIAGPAKTAAFFKESTTASISVDLAVSTAAFH
jgi:hypothetical protein